MQKVIILNDSVLGRNNRELGLKMMRGFLKVLGQREWKPKAVFFMGEAVRLLTGEFEFLEFLNILEQQGVELLACRAAVEELRLEPEIKVGKISSTGTLIDLMEKYEVISM